MSLYLSITVGALIGGAAGAGWWTWQILPAKQLKPTREADTVSSQALNPGGRHETNGIQAPLVPREPKARPSPEIPSSSLSHAPSPMSEAEIKKLAQELAKQSPPKTITNEHEHFQEQLQTSDAVAVAKHGSSKAESPCLNPIPFTQEIKQSFDGVEVHYITAFSLVNDAGFGAKLHLIVHFDGPIYEVGPTTWGKQMQIGNQSRRRHGSDHAK